MRSVLEHDTVVSDEEPDPAVCSHLATIRVTALPEALAGCEDCLATDGWWVHLRMCQACGRISCCDSSPNRHATAHARATGHPIARSAEPGENWSYCYLDAVAFVLERPTADGVNAAPGRKLA
jgi:uncharacterized UBP type Zn finger protein